MLLKRNRFTVRFPDANGIWDRQKSGYGLEVVTALYCTVKPVERPRADQSDDGSEQCYVVYRFNQ